MRGISAALGALAVSGCTQLTLSWADLKPDGPEATPAILGPFNGEGPVKNVAVWREARAPLLREALQRNVYGMMPEASETRVISRRLLNDDAFGGRGIVEEYVIAASATFGGVAVAAKSDLAPEGFIMDVATPKDAVGAPVILMETFCPRWSTIPDPAVARPEQTRERSGFGYSVETYVFGRYICTPPIEEILKGGYAVATIYPGEFAPDRREAGLAELRRLSVGHKDDETRWGAIAAWAWGFSRMIDALEDDPRYGPFITWGHSRYAKSALLAAAFDDRVSGVVSHQSGTGGASLNREKPGESVGSITESYPHWFARAYASWAGRENEMPVDQHMLLALIAPRSVLLGNARRDVWSDPNGAFRAAQGADAAYELLGSKGLTVARLDRFEPSADIAFWIRPGTHGVVEEDWPAFFRFLDAHW